MKKLPFLIMTGIISAVGFLLLRRKKDTTIISPPAGTPPSNLTPSENFIYHTVVYGDCLSMIAQSYNVSIKNIQKYNPEIIDIDKIFVGQVIKIPIGTSGEYFNWLKNFMKDFFADLPDRWKDKDVPIPR